MAVTIPQQKILQQQTQKTKGRFRVSNQYQYKNLIIHQNTIQLFYTDIRIPALETDIEVNF